MDNVLVLLVVSSAITSLASEAMKNQLGNIKVPNNILVGVVSIVVSVLLGFGYIIINNIYLSLQNLVFLVALVFLNWICAMTSYDKVIQTIAQISKLKK